MEILKDYLNKNISLCNKSNILEITIGKSVSPSIFNTNIYTIKNIKSLLNTLKNPEFKQKIDLNNKKLKRFYHENSIIEATIRNENNIQIEHYSKDNEIIDTINEKRFDLQLHKVFFYNDTTIINSPKFNYSEEIEQLELTINNSFSIIIEKSLGYYCKIQIYKPINIDIILDILNLFPNSSYS